MDEIQPYQPALTKVGTDDRLIELWLHGRPKLTRNEYQRDIERFRKFLNYAPLRSLTLEDLQCYQTHLQESGLKDSTSRRKLNAVKSLLTFATRLNYTPFNVAAALRIPKSSAILAGKVLKQNEILKLLALESHPRNAALLKLMYVTGARVSEVCRLKWQDFEEREDGQAQVTIFGKGQKYRTVIVPIGVWLELLRLKGDNSRTAYAFPGGKLDTHITRAMVHEIIKAAAKRAGLPDTVSAHVFRHCHAVHSLAKGAPLALVRDTLGHSSLQTTNFYVHSNPEDSSSKYLGL